MRVYGLYEVSIGVVSLYGGIRKDFWLGGTIINTEWLAYRYRD